MSTTTFFKVAADFNKEGATSCAQGDLYHGLQCFRQALTTMSAGANAMGHLGNRPSPGAGLLSRLPSASGAKAETTDKDIFFVFQDCILFNAVDAELTTTNLALFYSVIEFNLALTFHLRCMEGGGNNTNSVSRALGLYDSCLLHVRHAFEAKEAATILLVALNNKSQLLEQELGNVEGARQGLKDLLGAVTYCHQQSGIWTATEIEEIMLNVLVIRDLKTAAAA